MLSLKKYDIKYVKGIGPERAKLLTQELGISSARDLLYHFPSGYLDRSKTYTLRSLHQAGGSDTAVQVCGRFISFNTLGEGVKERLVGLFTDGSATMEVVWFRSLRTIRRSIIPNKEYILFGKVGMYNFNLQMSHPEVDIPGSAATQGGRHGTYPLTEKLRQRGISSRVIHDAVIQLFAKINRPLQETLPASVVASQNLMSLDAAIRQIHSPTGTEELRKARERLKFEELFIIQADMVRRSLRRKGVIQGYLMPRVGYWFNTFYKQQLPFELTGAQKRVIKEVRADIMSGRQMNRLIQGDVGSGKTLVALMCMLLVTDNEYQSCLMAPTEILATQHYQSIREMTAPLGLRVELLTGSTRRKQREIIDAGLRDGSIHILIGTHAVIEDPVEFKNLGFCVIDEQHRFGVAQRARLWNKSAVPPHVLVMTATPIPRTLAMTVYGDLDVSVIDELPPGRKPVATVLRHDRQLPDVYKAIETQLRQGRQAYIVYPLIEENEKLDLASLEEGYQEVCQRFGTEKIAFVHGRMKPAEKDRQMNRFASGQADILVATTVIEVGVNVPNATTMVIRNAERFGLSQLHQLRGRVGRGADKSYCVLVAKEKLSSTTRERLEIMTSTTDGFLIAEADMRLRGPGDIEGTMQSGLPFDLKLANLATDGLIIQQARQAAEVLLDDDPTLTKPENYIFARVLREAADRNQDWSQIS